MQRHNLIRFLTEACKDETVKKTYQEQTQASLKNGEYTRAFNPLRITVTESEVKKFHELLLDVPLVGSPTLRSVMKVEESDGAQHRYIFKNAEDTDRVIKLVKNIVAQTCAALLESDGYVQWRIINLLDWGTFQQKIREKSVLAQIVRSHIELVFGTLWTQVGAGVNRNREELLQVWSAVTDIASGKYRELIDEQLASYKKNAIREAVFNFVAALPAVVQAADIAKLVDNDLKTTKAYEAVNRDYAVFWVEVLLECYFMKRFDLFAVLLNELRNNKVIDILGEFSKDKYLFCCQQYDDMPKDLLASGAVAAVNYASDLSKLDKLLASRDNDVAINAILKEYTCRPASERDQQDEGAVSGLISPEADIANMPLLIRLRVIYCNLEVEGRDKGHLGVILNKYITLFQAKQHLVEGYSLDSESYSHVATLNLIGLHKPPSPGPVVDAASLSKKDNSPKSR